MAESMFMTVDEVLQELQIDKKRLDQMVEDGVLRAFRDGSSVKFRRQDVEKVREKAEAEPTVVKPRTPEGETEEESDQIFLIEDGKEVPVGEVPSEEEDEGDQTSVIAPEEEEPAAADEDPIFSFDEDEGIGLPIEEQSEGETEAPAAVIEEPQAVEEEEQTVPLTVESQESVESDSATDVLDVTEDESSGDLDTIDLDEVVLSDEATDDSVTGDLLDLVESTEEEGTSEPDEVVELISEEEASAVPPAAETVDLGEEPLEEVAEEELEAEEEEAPTFIARQGPEPQPLFTGLLVVSAVLLVYAGFIILNMATQTNNIFTNNPVTTQLGNLIINIFGK